MSKMIVIGLVFASALARAHQYEAVPHHIIAKLLEARSTPSPLECELHLLPGLVRRETPSYQIELHEAAGFIIRPGQKIPGELSSNFYLWQVWRNGDLAIVPRYNWKRFGRTGVGVNTHEAFELLYAKTYGQPIADSVIASGEARFVFGEFIFVNNKSGKYRGGPETLAVAERVLVDRGGVVTEHTTRQTMDFDDRLQQGHQPEDRTYDAWQIALMSSVLSQPAGLKIVELYERLGRSLKRLSRDGNVKNLQFLLSEGLGRERARFGAANLQYVFRSAVNTDGLYFAVHTDWMNMAAGKEPAEYDKYAVPAVIDAVLKLYSHLYAAPERDELLSIRAGFLDLPDRAGAYPAPGVELGRPTEFLFEEDISL